MARCQYARRTTRATRSTATVAHPIDPVSRRISATAGSSPTATTSVAAHPHARWPARPCSMPGSGEGAPISWGWRPGVRMRALPGGRAAVAALRRRQLDQAGDGFEVEVQVGGDGVVVEPDVEQLED